jgi:hypothetical protein
MYQVLSYERDRYDRVTLIRNHRRMGAKSFETALRWLKEHKFGELREQKSGGFQTVAIVKNGQVIMLR